MTRDKQRALHSTFVVSLVVYKKEARGGGCLFKGRRLFQIYDNAGGTCFQRNLKHRDTKRTIILKWPHPTGIISNLQSQHILIWGLAFKSRKQNKNLMHIDYCLTAAIISHSIF